MKGSCCVENCNEQVLCRGLCNRHYLRLRKFNNVHHTQKPRGSGSTDADRFWSRVAVTADSDRCWEWRAKARSIEGYGRLMVNGERWQAHRYALYITTGARPILHVLHSCDNPQCVNPKHLREGTNAENMQDRSSRGRQVTGEKVNTAKLTTNQVLAIRQSSLSVGELANQFDVTPSTIRVIRNRRTWTHV